MLIGRRGEIKTEAVCLCRLVVKECRAGNNRHLVLDRLFNNIKHIEFFGKLRPDKETALNLIIADIRANLFVKQTLHKLRLMLIDFADFGKVTLKIIFAHKLVCNGLSPDICVNILGLLADSHFCDYFLRRNCISDPHSGGKHLGEGAGIYHDTLFVKALDTGNVFPFKTKLAIGVILYNNYVMFKGKLVKRLALFKRHAGSAGILEIRNGVYKLGILFAVKSFFKRLDIHSVGFHGYALKVDSERTEGIKRTDK